MQTPSKSKSATFVFRFQCEHSKQTQSMLAMANATPPASNQLVFDTSSLPVRLTTRFACIALPWDEVVVVVVLVLLALLVPTRLGLLATVTAVPAG